MLLQS
jgi:hypothetical protein